MKANESKLSCAQHELVRIGKQHFQESKQVVHFTSTEESNRLVNDLTNYPHAFVLACLMDKQIPAERAWKIPWKIKEELGSFSIGSLCKKSKDEYIRIFTDRNLHRFNNDMANIFYSGIQRIVDEYQGDASKIWENNPSSSTVVYRFLEFDGCGIKIATMAANILAREFKIPFKDYYSIDVSPDVHVKKVLKRMGLIDKEDATLAIYKARELNPEYPGIIDYSCWTIGREYCYPTNPKCDVCIVRDYCNKQI